MASYTIILDNNKAMPFSNALCHTIDKATFAYWKGQESATANTRCDRNTFENILSTTKQTPPFFFIPITCQKSLWNMPPHQQNDFSFK